MVAPIGHWSSRFAEGARVMVFGETRAHRGCLLPMVEWGVSRDHGVEDVAQGWDNLELRIEDAVFSAADVARLGIEVGDFIALDSHPEVLDNGYVVGRNLDNKAGTAAVLELIRHLVESGERPTHDTYVIFTVTETIGAGMGGAVMPEVSELVTVDFASVRSTEKSPFKRVTLASGDASGPYDFHLTAHLRKIAERAEIPIQQKHLKAFHSDAAAALVAGNDVRTAVLAYAGDASHSVERTHVDSLMNIARLLDAYVTSEPTFSEDDAVVPVEQFSHQFRSEQLPHVTEVPDTASVLSAHDEGAKNDDDD
jgi:putative aminopeptidase FrvX